MTATNFAGWNDCLKSWNQWPIFPQLKTSFGGQLCHSLIVNCVKGEAKQDMLSEFNFKWSSICPSTELLIRVIKDTFNENTGPDIWKSIFRDNWFPHYCRLVWMSRLRQKFHESSMAAPSGSYPQQVLGYFHGLINDDQKTTIRCCQAFQASFICCLF